MHEPHYVKAIQTVPACSYKHRTDSSVCSFHGDKNATQDCERSHVVRNKNGIELIVEEAIAEVHALLFAARINRHDTRVDDDDNADNLVLLLDDGTRYQWNDVGGLVLARLQLNDGHQQVAPREYRT